MEIDISPNFYTSLFCYGQIIAILFYELPGYLSQFILDIMALVKGWAVFWVGHSLEGEGQIFDHFPQRPSKTCFQNMSGHWAELLL